MRTAYTLGMNRTAKLVEFIKGHGFRATVRSDGRIDGWMVWTHNGESGETLEGLNRR